MTSWARGSVGLGGAAEQGGGSERVAGLIPLSFNSHNEIFKKKKERQMSTPLKEASESLRKAAEGILSPRIDAVVLRSAR